VLLGVSADFIPAYCQHPHTRVHSQPLSLQILYILRSSWGTQDGAHFCKASIDSSKLVVFKKNHKLVLLCGIADPSVDQYQDESVSFSTPYTITGRVQTVQQTVSKVLEEKIQLYHPSPPATQVSLWVEPVVVPLDQDMSRLKKLADVKKDGGKIIDPRYY